MSTRRACAHAVLTCCFLACAAQAQDAAPAAPAKKDAVDENAIRALITQLGDDAFATREAAQKRLAKIGLPALGLLRQAAKESKDQESRERAEELVQEIRLLLYRPVLKDKDWGDSADPDGDCLFRVDLGKLHIKIPGKPHRLGIELGAMNAPRVLRAIEGDFQAEVSVVGGSPSDKRRLVGKLPWHGAGLLVWQDDKNYIRLERARMHFAPNTWECYVSWELRRDGKFVRKGVAADGILDAEHPAFFRLDRKGDVFTATYSQDGKQWRELAPIQAAFGKKLGVGVAAVQNTPSGYEAVFESLHVTSNKN